MKILSQLFRMFLGDPWNDSVNVQLCIRTSWLFFSAVIFIVFLQ